LFLTTALVDAEFRSIYLGIYLHISLAFSTVWTIHDDVMRYGVII